MLLRREGPELLGLLRKTFQAALNAASCGSSEKMWSLVHAAWDLLGRIIHHGGHKAASMFVSSHTSYCRHSELFRCAGLTPRGVSQAMPPMGRHSLWSNLLCPLRVWLACAQAHRAFTAAFELLPRAFSLRSGRRSSQAGAPSATEQRSLGDLFWLTGLLLLGTDCSAALSPAWAASVQQVKLQCLPSLVSIVVPIHIETLELFNVK